MNQSITTLAINLLISERLNHRILFAGKIIEILHQSLHDFDNEEDRLNTFMATISQCTQEPNCSERDRFYDHAQYFNNKIFGQANIFAVA